MKCPKCGREMETGFLQCNMESPIYWVRKLMPFGLGYWKNDTEIVSEPLNHGQNAMPAFICKQCRLVIGDYSQKK